MGDRAVLMVKGMEQIDMGIIHRHLGVILRYLFQGVRDLSIYVGYETLFMFVYMVYSLKMVSTKDHEACDWVIGTHISDK